jgi:hypothetical protein
LSAVVHKFVVSIRPEFRATISAQAFMSALSRIPNLVILEGEGRRTVTVACETDLSEFISRIPEALVREYEAIALLEG